MSSADPEVFPPTLREVMLRPWWLGMLAFALLLAAVFAWLGQWQLSSALDTAPVEPGATENVRPLDDVATPGEYLSDPLVGQKVEVTGSFVADDFVIVSSRYNDGAAGFWVTGQLRIADAAAPTSLAVAVGWTADRDEAEAAGSALNDDPPQGVTLTGRIISDEGPALPRAGAPATEMARMSPAALLGVWHDVDGLSVYRAYLTAAEPLGGLTAIHSPAPEERGGVNWLNIFYAVEWAIFAGFAFYMWYRLARDAWEKELEELEVLEESPLPTRD
ncbi:MULTISPECIES: SURF1 family cytochrome oxidase biogenesis protein [Microbacterium]|uniref:SURF1-like protein n=1 Tax=Microbacterium saccharophilum TaxID=1213358 RepID=A0A7Z7GEB3_9MICO|nr:MULTISPECIES: SURF1 family cytochrome oxidase biogenesis protein [Microbacterium]SFI68559.1 Cytochrome oxidase assembly protein ShyY1 [Microbacterium saccharophilum]